MREDVEGEGWTEWWDGEGERTRTNMRRDKEEEFQDHLLSSPHPKSQQK